jgi:hypothetical protein
MIGPGAGEVRAAGELGAFATEREFESFGDEAGERDGAEEQQTATGSLSIMWRGVAASSRAARARSR